MPKVSFIVAVYNSMPYLTQCIDSLLSQTVKDIEVICVNDCSPDNSAEVISDYIKKDSRVKLINHTTNRRQGGAWNSGVKVATGEYLCFVDADDWLDTDYAEVLNETSNDADILCAKNYYAGNDVRNNINPTKLKKCGNDIRLNNLLYGCFFITNFYKKSYFENISFQFEENNMFHDYLTTTLYFKTDKIILFGRAGYHYRIDNQSITRSKDQQGFWGRLEMAQKEHSALLNSPLAIKYRNAIDYHFYFLFYRNSLMHAFHGYTKYPKERARQIARETKKIVPQIKKNPFYKERFANWSFMEKLPVILVDCFPIWIVAFFHEFYFTTTKTLSNLYHIVKH